jgi:hypothetical protein
VDFFFTGQDFLNLCLRYLRNVAAEVHALMTDLSDNGF